MNKVQISEQTLSEMIEMKENLYSIRFISDTLKLPYYFVRDTLREKMPHYQKYSASPEYTFTEKEIQQIIKLRMLPSTYRSIADFLRKSSKYPKIINYNTIRKLLLEHFPNTKKYNQNNKKHPFTKEEIQQIIHLRTLPSTYRSIAEFLKRSPKYSRFINWGFIRKLLLRHFPNTKKYNQLPRPKSHNKRHSDADVLHQVSKQRESKHNSDIIKKNQTKKKR